MTVGERVEQTRAELKEALSEQLSLLMAMNERYDAGEHFLPRAWRLRFGFACTIRVGGMPSFISSV